MAEEKISFNISSYFKGEGFTKATAATTTLANNTKKASNAVTSVTSQLGVLDGAVGKWAGSIGNLIPMLTSWAGVSALLVTGGFALGKELGKMIVDIKQLTLESKLLTIEMRGLEIRLDGLADKLKKQDEAYRKQEVSAAEYAKTLNDAIRQLEDAYKALDAAESSVSGAKGALKITQITNEFNAKLRAAADAIDKGVIKAEMDMAVAMEKHAQSIASASSAVERETESLYVLDGQIKYQKSVIEEKNKIGEETAAEETKLKALLTQRAAQEKKLEAANLTLENERLKAADSESSHRASLESLRQANQEARERREEIAQLELDYAEELRNTKQAATDAWNTLQRKIESLTDQAETALAGQKRTQSGMAADQKYHSGISGGGYTYSTDANGNADNFIDWERAQRYAGRAEREAERGERRNASAQKRYDDLKAKRDRGDKLSDRERDYLDNYEAFSSQRKTKSEWQQAIDDLKGDQNKTITHLHEDLAKITEKFKELGVQ